MIREWMKRICSIILIMALGVGEITSICFWVSVTTYAKERTADIGSEIYVFGEDDEYAFSLSDISKSTTAYGVLSISGNISNISEMNGMTSFAVKRNYDEAVAGLTISYTYNNSLLNATEDEWHIVKDSTKKIDTVVLDEKIGKGALLLQTSRDGEIWVTVYSETNAFENVPVRTEAFYSTTDVEMANGCYYRMIVAYETGRKLDSKKLLFFDEYEYMKYAEVYKFYVYDEVAQASVVEGNTKKYNLGSKVRTEKYDGYYGETTITKNDPHYGWDLGQFFISGYTDNIKDAEGNIVFLKNVGDQVTLWFNLEHDINCLNGNEDISIMEDSAGSDQYFETPSTDFGHGALIVRKTNYENVTETPIIYTNYLEAVATVGSDTKVNLFEEGDYEVALDYAVKYKKKALGIPIPPEEAHYRIYFKFSVRNSNSMFFPRDIKTTSELANNAITPNGFYLDLANSKYLQLNIVREILKDGGIGLSEDIRFNKSAKDGDRYTEEGVYTVTVTNQYTGRMTTKKLYVGENNILKAYMVTGLSVSEIQNKIAMGAVIADDGTIIESVIDNTPDENEIIEESSHQIEEVQDDNFFDAAVDISNENSIDKLDKLDGGNSNGEDIGYRGDKSRNKVLLIAVGVLTVVCICGLIISKSRAVEKRKEKDGEDDI